MKTHDPDDWKDLEPPRLSTLAAHERGAALAALAGGEPRPVAGMPSRSSIPSPLADTLILLWLAGGMAAPEDARSQAVYSRMTSASLLEKIPALYFPGDRYRRA